MEVSGPNGSTMRTSLKRNLVSTLALLCYKGTRQPDSLGETNEHGHRLKQFATQTYEEKLDKNTDPLLHSKDRHHIPRPLSGKEKLVSNAARTLYGKNKKLPDTVDEQNPLLSYQQLQLVDEKNPFLSYQQLQLVDEQNEEFLAQLAKSHHEEGNLIDIIDPDLHKQMDLQSFDIFSETAYSCLKEQRSQRPNIDQIVIKLERALELQRKHENLVINGATCQTFMYDASSKCAY
ncbi:hypothetical protein Tco_1478719 [Tanacetum coccineum]